MQTIPRRGNVEADFLNVNWVPRDNGLPAQNREIPQPIPGTTFGIIDALEFGKGAASSIALEHGWPFVCTLNFKADVITNAPLFEDDYVCRSAIVWNILAAIGLLTAV